MDRRNFLRGAVAAAALPVIAPLAPAVPPLAINMLPPIVHMPPAPSITGALIMQMERTGNHLLTADQFAREAAKLWAAAENA
jgi:hypothetical protein